jgi:murein DD-endopeptidase MepM/ murein hydrolase activator NlpD
MAACPSGPAPTRPPAPRTPSRAVALAVVPLLFAACLARAPVGHLAAGPLPEDAYLLPFPAGTSATCLQEGPGPFSHDGEQAYAVDFAMPVGSPVVAMRGGTVVAVKEDSDRGGNARSFAPHGNQVRIRHADGTRATYLHLEKDGALVEVGETVRRGQVIGRSGSTGWSQSPHLHVQVDAADAHTGAYGSVPLRFADVRGDGIPRMLVAYESANAPPAEPPAAGRVR